MKYLKQTPPRKWSPRDLWTPAMISMIGMMICKLLLFDVFWCLETSWSALFTIKPYAYAILLSFILSIPVGMFRCKWLQLAILFAMDIGCTQLLFQGEGLLTHLPLMDRLLTGGLSEMGTGDARAFQWYALFLPLTTLAALAACLKSKEKTSVPIRGKIQ